MVSKENLILNAKNSSCLLLEDLSEVFASKPIIIVVLGDAFLEISWDKREISSKKSSSWPDVGRYAVYAIMSILSFCNLTPEKREETISSFTAHEETEECQPNAVPCHTGPDFTRISSGERKESMEVVMNS